MLKYCLKCNTIIRGRPDKKFCSDNCRNNYNHTKEKSSANYLKTKVDKLSWQANYKYSHYREVIFSNAKRRANLKNLPFNIDVNDIIIPEVCPLLNIPLLIGKGRTNNSPSLDRIIPELGYVKGNVWIISWKANRIKSNLSKEEMIRFCSNLLKKIC